MHRAEAGGTDPSGWSEKGTADFVTEVDLESERRIVRTLRERFPRHRIVAEEGTQEEDGPETSGGRQSRAPAGRPEAAERRAEARPEPSDGARDRPDADVVHWIVDPLDGTTNFLHGYPEYAVSIAGIDEAGLRVAVVLNSATGERFEAVRGGGARRNGEPIRVSPLSRMRLALVGTGLPFKREELLPAYLGMFSRVLRATSGIRRGGSAALDLCDLACGRVDAFWELWLMPWDIAAGALIVREAGGSFGPLELEGEAAWGEGRGAETLREAAAAAGAFAAVWDGGFDASAPRDIGGEASPTGVTGREEQPATGPDRLWRGGAYMGTNAELLQKFKGILSGSPAG